MGQAIGRGKKRLFRNLNSFLPFKPSFSKVGDQSSILYQFLHKRWDGFCKILFLPCQVEDFSCGQIHLNHISVLDLPRRLRRFKKGKSLVKSIPVENARKGFCNDARDPRRLQGQGSMFPGRTAAEILFGHKNISSLDFPNKFGSLILHCMSGELSRIRLIEIAGGNDRVSVNIGSEFPNSSFNFH